jgi:exodeoxyribonuclease VII small subunit
MPTKNINFEKSLDKLDQLIEKMEQGNLPLETSLQHFEDGVKLIRLCQETLNTAQQKVKVLMEKQGETSLEDFDAND